jgi:hypothetical protein
MTEKLWIIRTISSHELVYALSSDKSGKDLRRFIEDRLKSGDLDNFAQKWHGEKIESITESTEDKFLDTFDQYNIVQKSWAISSKLDQINGPVIKEMIIDDEDLL